MHLGLDLYLLALRRLVPAGELVRLAHRHLLDACPACHLEHRIDRQSKEDEEAGEGGFTAIPPQPPASQLGPLPPLPEDDRHLGARHLERRLPVLEEIRGRREVNRRHLRHLLSRPPETWVDEVEAAHSRYRSPSFAELLLEESRRTVRRRPDLAFRLAALVPVVLHWIPETGDTPWAAGLRVRAVAWQANALRVAGDLAAAQGRFELLDVDALLGTGGWAGAETASLLASLRIDQRRLPEALELLRHACDLFLRVGDAEAAARTRVKQGNLQAEASRPREALDRYRAAAELCQGESALDPIGSSILAGRIGALCDLGRFREARDLLQPCQPLSGLEDPHLRAVLRYNRGRIAAGEERHGDAVPDLASARDGFLDTGRIYDAALVSLDLAHAYLRAGRTATARELARNLVPQFEARGVGREALAALAVLADAVATEELGRDLLARLRRQILAAPRMVQRPVG